jgi:hypothetical protein
MVDATSAQLYFTNHPYTRAAVRTLTEPRGVGSEEPSRLRWMIIISVIAVSVLLILVVIGLPFWWVHCGKQRTWSSGFTTIIGAGNRYFQRVRPPRVLNILWAWSPGFGRR